MNIYYVKNKDVAYKRPRPFFDVNAIDGLNVYVLSEKDKIKDFESLVEELKGSNTTICAVIAAAVPEHDCTPFGATSYKTFYRRIPGGVCVLTWDRGRKGWGTTLTTCPTGPSMPRVAGLSAKDARQTYQRAI